VWSARRFEDPIRLQSALCANDAHFCLTAGKTGTTHRIPIPDWMRPHLQPVRLPYGDSLDWSGQIIRDSLARVCLLSSVPRILPSQIRDRGLNEWARANPGIIGLLHGSGLGVLRHYLDPLELLQSVQHRVRVPECFGASVDTAETMMISFRRLDPAAQQLVSDTAARLAQG